MSCLLSTFYCLLSLAFSRAALATLSEPLPLTAKPAVHPYKESPESALPLYNYMREGLG